MNSARRRLDAHPEKYPHISSNGLRVTKRTSQGVTLAWPEHETDVVTFTDSKVSCLDIETELDAEGNWFWVQMRKMDDDPQGWVTIYKGYGLRCDVDDLDADSLILFRMKRNGDSKWGTEIIASTDPPQATAEDLNRAVEMNSQYLVTRILGNTPHGHLKKILTAHDKNGMTPLMVACHNGNQTIAKMLLGCGAPVNDASTGVKRTPLMFACIIGKHNVVQMLDQHGCDWRPMDKSGCNALHHAINGGNLAIVRFAFAKLASHKLAFEPDHCGWTPLMRAVITSQSLDIVKFLVGKGSDINNVDRTNNKSVLMAAILSRKTDFVKFLVEWGADPFYKNANGKNCLDVARGLGYKEIATVVREHMEILQPNLPRDPSMLGSTTKNNNNNDNIFSVDALNNNSKRASNTRSRRSSPTSISTEASDIVANTDNSNLIHSLDTLDENSDSELGNPTEKIVSVVPLHSISSVLETKYLMRPNAQEKR